MDPDFRADLETWTLLIFTVVAACALFMLIQGLLNA